MEADSKKAVEKADKLTQRLSEREQAEGRMGGEAGQRIVYDQAAIDRLLDRSAVSSDPLVAELKWSCWVGMHPLRACMSPLNASTHCM